MFSIFPLGEIRRNRSRKNVFIDYVTFTEDETEPDNKPKSNQDLSNSSEEANEKERQLELLKNTKKRFGKNPFVDTSFLPDKEREFEEDMLRYKL